MDSYILIRKEGMEAALKAAPMPGKHLLGSFHSFVERGFPLRIIEDSELPTSQSELHTKEGDLVLCLEGEIEFVCGGELIDPTPLKLQDGSVDETNVLGHGIRGGERIILKAGDWLWIPSNVAHMHTCAGTGRLGITKIPNA